MVVLVNDKSAGASEIVAACLQDHGRAAVVGQRTWGKGTVQSVIPLEGGKSLLKLTIASYWRPSGKNIHRLSTSQDEDEWGVTPDPGCEVKLDEKQMVELRSNRHSSISCPVHRPPIRPRESRRPLRACKSTASLRRPLKCCKRSSHRRRQSRTPDSASPADYRGAHDCEAAGRLDCSRSVGFDVALADRG